MKNSASLALAAVLALSGATAASAASHMSARSERMANTSDTLALSGNQQQTIAKDVSRHASNQTAPQGFNAHVGEAVPSSISTYPLPRQAARDVPAVRPYRYAMTQDKVLIVNPSDRKIADVVNK